MVDKVMYPQPVIPVGPSRDGAKQERLEKQGQVRFKEILESQLSAGELKFSAHARERLAARNISLTTSDLADINKAVDRAAQKGSRDSLIMKGNLAFVVSVKNKTVITAVDNASMKEHVFTNIDSAVII